MHDPYAPLDATAQAALVRQGDVTPLELVDAAIARIERLNPTLNAVIHSRFEQARRDAREPLPDGPFRGVPFLLKDLDATSLGDPMHAGTKFLKAANYVPDHDSALVENFKRAGLVLLGKANTPEFGLNITTEPEAYGATRNPWNPEHSAGGSSGGSAAAVAAGLVPIAHASDGGGSIRIPASECGLVGLKPSRGRISAGPDYGEFWAGFVTSHVVSRSVRDSATALDCIAGPQPGDPYTAPLPARPFAAEVGADPGRLRIGVLRHVPTGASDVHPDCVAAVDRAAQLLADAGHSVEEAFPAALAESETVSAGFTTLVFSWVAATLAEWEAKLGRALGSDDVEPATWMSAELGRSVSAAQYIGNLHRLHAFTRRMASWWSGGFDILVTPTLGEPPPRIGELVPPRDNPIAGMARAISVMAFTPPYNITGQPAMSLPLHWNEAGLPVGVQFVAAYAREDLLLRLAAQLEAAQPWAQRWPDLAAAR